MGLYGAVLVREISDTLYHSAIVYHNFRMRRWILDVRCTYTSCTTVLVYGFPLFDMYVLRKPSIMYSV